MTVEEQQKIIGFGVIQAMVVVGVMALLLYLMSFLVKEIIHTAVLVGLTMLAFFVAIFVVSAWFKAGKLPKTQIFLSQIATVILVFLAPLGLSIATREFAVAGGHEAGGFFDLATVWMILKTFSLPMLIGGVIATVITYAVMTITKKG